MSEVYTIITDEKLLQEFVEWLPDHTDTEMYYCCLFARKKYNPTHAAVQSDKLQLKRFTATKERLISKIRQLECRVGAYRGANDLPIPQDTLALYISPNPRCLRKSTFKAISHFANCLENEKPINPHQEVLTVIQSTKAKTRYHVFDIDSKDKQYLLDTTAVVDGLCTVINTRGGYHVLVDNEHIHEIVRHNKNWYVDLKKRADVTGDALIPVVGCYQGGHTPSIVTMDTL